MGINERKTVTVSDVSGDECFKERGLAGTGFADDVEVRETVGLFDAESCTLVVEVRASKVGDVWQHTSMVWGETHWYRREKVTGVQHFRYLRSAQYLEKSAPSWGALVRETLALRNSPHLQLQ
ncbi:MAG: hypothetical protein AB2693_25220 [Candidatus Thiodiazotropha sp.]